MKKPDFKFEKQAWRKGYKLVIGVDEVGRGALAGPVVAAAVALVQGEEWEKLGIDDSKRLRPRTRERLAKIIQEKAKVGVGEVGVTMINRLGITKATAMAMRSAVAKVQKDRSFVLVDAFHVKYVPGVGLKNQKAIVKGDQKSLSIAAASIIAKVYRDALMKKLARKRPGYGWGRNKAYGTAEHQRAIRKLGLTRHHRLAFVKKFL